MIKTIFRPASHLRTPYTEMNPRLCVACGACVQACPHRVLGLVRFLKHRHVHVDHSGMCKGCGRCIQACTHGAVRARATE